MPSFTDDLLRALNAWQNGWREDQVRRLALASDLGEHAAELGGQFRSADSPCFRKRFILKGELVGLLLEDHLDEGMTSWTTDQRFAERFKGLTREGAVCAAIYCHTPAPEEVVVNLGELWRCSDFVRAAESFQARHPDDARALFCLRDRQSEVVLTAPLKGSEVVALSGASSSFDELCDSLSIPEEEREARYRRLVEEGVYPGELRYTYAAPDVIARTIAKFRERLEAHRAASDKSTA